MATCPQCRTTYPNDTLTCPKDGMHLLDDAVVANADPPIMPGDVIGEYRVEDKLGEGGFGVVYRAVHPVIGKAAAIKVLSRRYSADPEIVSRFVSEARAVNQIKNKNIIDIFAFGGLRDGRQYYVMELLEGAPLDRHLDRLGRLSPEEAVPILVGIARALDAAHAAGIAHRDLKPENVFLAVDDDHGYEPKLLDFGIAKLFGESSPEHQTRTGVPLGTPYYMSPEQCRGKKVDYRTDIYSFGVLAYKLLTGSLPFQSEAFMDVMMMHVSEEPPAMSTHVADLAPLDASVAHMLAKDPDARPSSALAALQEMAAAARAAGHDVKVPEARVKSSGGELRSEPRLPRGMTPSEIAALASADTLARATTASVGTPPPTLARQPRKLPLAIAAGIVVAATAAWFATRPATHAKPAITSATAAAVPRDVAATPTRAAALPPPAPDPTVIELSVESVPKDVDVYLGDQKLGSAPGPLTLPRGREKVELTLKADGYVPRNIEFTPSSNGVVSATLQKVRRVSHPHGGKKPEVEF